MAPHFHTNRPSMSISIRNSITQSERGPWRKKPSARFAVALRVEVAKLIGVNWRLFAPMKPWNFATAGTLPLRPRACGKFSATLVTRMAEVRFV